MMRQILGLLAELVLTGLGFFALGFAVIITAALVR